MVSMMPKFVPAAVIDGVWGPNARYVDDFNGGEKCAAQSSPQYKLIVNLILLPFYIGGWSAYKRYSS